MRYIWCFIFVTLVYVIGYIIGRKLEHDKMNRRVLGTIRIDHSDPVDGPYLFLELETDPSALTQQEYAIFKVNVSDYISHK